MKNKYKHGIDLKKININNSSRELFSVKLEALDYRGYEVEEMKDNRKIVITKPGGKSTIYGRPKKEDFLVFIYDSTDETLWQITHKQILKDLELKSAENKEKTICLINFLERTLNGEEPTDFIQEIEQIQFESGEPPELIIKVYKWIWGQEDVNYPNGKGRYLSWEAINDLREKLKNA